MPAAARATGPGRSTQPLDEQPGPRPRTPASGRSGWSRSARAPSARRPGRASPARRRRSPCARRRGRRRGRGRAARPAPGQTPSSATSASRVAATPAPGAGRSGATARCGGGRHGGGDHARVLERQPGRAQPRAGDRDDRERLGQPQRPAQQRDLAQPPGREGRLRPGGDLDLAVRRRARRPPRRSGRGSAGRCAAPCRRGEGRLGGSASRPPSAPLLAHPSTSRAMSSKKRARRARRRRPDPLVGAVDQRRGLEQGHVALGAEAVDGRRVEALRNQWLSEKPGITIGTSRRRGRSPRPTPRSRRERRFGRRGVADHVLDELELHALDRSRPKKASEPLAHVGLAQPGRHPAVDQDLGGDGDHVVLLRGASPRRHQRDAAASARPGRRPAAVRARGARRGQPSSSSGAGAGQLLAEHAGEERDARFGVGSRRRLLAQRREQRRELQQRVVAERRAPRRARPCRGCAAGSGRRPSRRRRACRGAGRRPRSEAPPPSLTTRSARTLSGCSSQSHLAPVCGARLLVGRARRAAARRARAPALARQRDAAAASAATWSFMSCAPRPRTSPSTTSPAHGSKLHSARRRPGPCRRGRAGTASGPSPSPRRRATRFGRSGSSACEQLALEARVAQALGEQLLDRQLLVAGRVRGVEPDQLAQQLDRLGARAAVGSARSPPVAG